MPFLFSRLPVVSGNTSLPTISSSDIDLLVDYEPGAFEHWDFGNGSGSLAGRKGGSPLTPPVGSTHSFTSTNLILSPQSGKALQSTMQDRLDMTTIMVVKRPTSAPGGVKFLVLSGTARNTSGDTLGSLLYVRQETSVADQINSWQRPNLITTNPNQPWPSASSVGDWIFIAMAEDGANKTITQFVGGEGAETMVQASNKTPSSRNVSLGNLTYAEAFASTTPNLEIAEYILFDRYVPPSEIATIYARSKARMAERSITVI